MAKLNTFQRMRDLSFQHKAVLALYLAQRMLPNYELFHQVTGFGDPKPLHGAINACWGWLSAPQQTKVNFARWQEKVDEVTPSEHGHDMLGVYPAMDACTALSTLLQGLLDKNDGDLVNVAKVSQASVAKFIELSEGDKVDSDTLQKLLREHELVEYEIDIQQAMLGFLESQPQVSASLVKQVQTMVDDEGMSNIGVMLAADDEATPTNQ